MQHPGISRAVPMGIVGFLLGALIVMVLRGLQSLDPLWSPGVGIIFGTLFSAAFTMWGIGAFDPKLSVHGEAEHHDEVEEAPKPYAFLTDSIWQIATVLVLVFIALFAFAALGGLTLKTTADPLASATEVGFFTLQLPFDGPEVLLSELVVFIAFILITFISLAIAAFLIAKAFTYLDTGIAVSKLEAKSGAAGLPSGSAAVAALPSGSAVQPASSAKPSDLALNPVRVGVYLIVALAVFLVFNNVIFNTLFPQTADVQLGLSLMIALGVASVAARPFFIGLFLFLFVAMFYLFYWILVGLVVPVEPIRTVSSLASAFIFALLILRPTLLLQTLGRIAALVARFLRWLPKLLFQKG